MSVSQYVDFSKRMNDMAMRNGTGFDSPSYSTGFPRYSGHSERSIEEETRKRIARQEAEREKRRKEDEERSRRLTNNIQRQNQWLVTSLCLF
ncbi:Uncharacterised protein [Acinetobacter phage MD-2021a]|nr:hypothetical protein PhaR5_199 [Acinetobacter phage PhaR5]CAH1068169.1 Uncharacterised protein [Acinetobacter phage MD-2021a]CAH1068437.1 Uncharacterised protein [Acinetobacter phage MD-2021a]